MNNRKYKDNLFSFLFGSNEHKIWTLDLYNAINHTHYEDADSLEINTIDDVIYLGMKNDVSFLLYDTLNLYEHQSTYNPNIPVRGLMYVGKLYDKFITSHRFNIYSTKQLLLPIPKLVVFCNGSTEREEKSILKLSDSFPTTETNVKSDVEVNVTMYNINYGNNRKLLESCKPLAEYAWLIDQIRMNVRNHLSVEEAVDAAINEVPADYLIKKFLMGHKAEVKNMCLTEYDEEATMNMFKEEFYQDGLEDGLKQGREQGQSQFIQQMISNGKSAKEIAEFVGMDMEAINELIKHKNDQSQ